MTRLSGLLRSKSSPPSAVAAGVPTAAEQQKARRSTVTFALKTA
jgi:hypothetical protein